jgi:hypothetical protein
MTARAAILLSAAILSASVLAAQTMSGGRVSKTMSSLDAQSFASALAQAGHHAGFIMPIAERQVMLPPDSGELLTLDEAIAAFTARGTYRASKHGGVTVFTHRGVPADVMDVLEIPLDHYPVKGTFSLALYDVVLRRLARRPVRTIAQKEPGASAECPVEQNISLPAGKATSIQMLNALVSRVKGVAWVVRFGQPGDSLRLQIGYVCGNGVWSALSVPGW